jgi:hypothetical protein
MRGKVVICCLGVASSDPDTTSSPYANPAKRSERWYYPNLRASQKELEQHEESLMQIRFFPKLSVLIAVNLEDLNFPSQKN